MYQESKFHHASIPQDKVQVLELPYKGDDITMVLVLPNAGMPLEEVERGLTSEKLQDWIDSMMEVSLYVYLPRFRVEDSFSVKEKLRKMGLEDLFSPENARLPGQTWRRGGVRWGETVPPQAPGQWVQQRMRKENKNAFGCCCGQRWALWSSPTMDTQPCSALIGSYAISCNWWRVFSF